MARFASVYPLVTARALAREFTYEVPDDVAAGAVVEVRFGNVRRRAVVTALDVPPPQGVRVAPVERVVDELPRELVELALWIADYYGSTPGRALALIAPLRRKARGERPQPAERDALAGEDAPARLSDTQRTAVDRIVSALDAAESKNVLLYGATGSGKTEVYLQACAAALERGRGAIVLVPEIALTPQTVGRFRARFGERIAILHSALSEAERRDERDRIGSGEAPIVVGARSAIFAPVRSLGLICVDEEHDASYKQESDPRYDARTVAAKRASLESAVAIFGSATPRPESWERLERLELGARLTGPLPPVDDHASPERLRARLPLGLLYGSYCPPDLRIGKPDAKKLRAPLAAASLLPCIVVHAESPCAARIAMSRSFCTATACCDVITADIRNPRRKHVPPAARRSSRGSVPGRNDSSGSSSAAFRSWNAFAWTPTPLRSRAPSPPR